MARKGLEANSNQLKIQFPPDGMAPLIAQAVADESRRSEGPSVVVTGEWHKVRNNKHAKEIADDIADQRQTGLDLTNR